MSTAAKLTLASTTLGAIGIVIMVHYQQKAEKAAMHAGVIRDLEQQRLKRERMLDFEMQRKLEEEYRKGTQADAESQIAQSRIWNSAG